MFKSVKSTLGYADSHDLYPDFKFIGSAAEPEVVIDGKKYLMFSSNNYLGLATHPLLVNTAIEAIRKYGVGSGGSRLLSGNLKVHRDFELAIAKFEGGEDAIVWPSGYSANVGVLSAILTPFKLNPLDFLSKTPLVLSDELNHASIVDGIKLSKQAKLVYKHCDLADLEKLLKVNKNREKLVVTDSVFSMDGDIAPLDKIVALCKKYDALLMIDEAHATGVIGNNGHGGLEHFGLKCQEDVQIVLGTCSKALASTGGFVVGSEELIKFLRVASRSYMFSTAMTPMASAVLIKALDVINNDKSRRDRLQGNSKYAREQLRSVGYDTLKSETQIIPIMIGDEAKAVIFSREMFKRGIFCPSVRWPAVEKGKARIRFTIMSEHSKDQIDTLVFGAKEVGKQLGLI